MRVTVSLPDDIAERSKAYCKDRGMTFSGLVRICLKKEVGERYGDER